MSKLNLAILDNDTRYMDNFANYVTGHYRHRFNLSTFTNVEALINHVRKIDVRTDIFLISAIQYGEWIKTLETGLIILLSSSAQSASAANGGSANAGVANTGGVNAGVAMSVGANTGGANAGGANTGGARSGASPAGSGADRFEHIDRYCGADKLVADVLKIYANNDRQQLYTETVRGSRENKVITVVSAEGGSGKTSVAIALSAHFSKLKLKTLFIGLDFLSAEDFAFESERDGGLSEIIYTMKTRPDRLGLKLEALEKSAPGYGFFYFAPPLYPMDIDEIQPADIETLIAKLRGAGIYDRVVIDTHNGLSLRNKSLMELSDSIVIIARGGANGVKKLYMFKEQIDKSFGGQAADLYRRCQIIINNVNYYPYASQGADAWTHDANTRTPGANTRTQGADSWTPEANVRMPGSVYGYHNDTPPQAPGSIDDISDLFSAKATCLPYCRELSGEYSPEALAGISHGFGASLAEIARRA